MKTTTPFTTASLPTHVAIITTITNSNNNNNKKLSNNNATINKVPRPMNCFMTYRLEKQREIIEKCPGANHRDISKIIAKWWKEMTPAEKDPYRLRAEKAKADHTKLYPGYKFCPKKKISKPRAYKKRPENEFTARDFENKKQLFELYHEGKEPSEATAKNLLIDYVPKKKSNNTTTRNNNNNNNNNNKRSSSSPLSLAYPSSSTSSSKRSHQDSPYNTELLFPSSNCGNGGSYYSGSASVPTQSVYSPSPSPYDDLASNDCSGDACTVNYNLYPTHYAYATTVEGPTTAAYTYAYHPYASTASYYHHYGHESSAAAATATVIPSQQQQSGYHHIKTTGYAVSSQQLHHSVVPRGGSEPASFAPMYNGYSTPPSLLTRPFYYLTQ